MAVNKQKIVVGSVLGIAVLVFAGGVYLAISNKSGIAETDQKIKRLNSDLRALAAGPAAPGDPDQLIVPSEENLAVLDERIASFDEKIEELRSSFATPEDYFDKEVDEFNFLPRIQGFVSELRDRFEMVPGLLEEGEVTLENPQEGFGFGLYLGSAATPEDALQRERIDLERQIVGVLMNELIGSYAGTKGGKLIEVRREAIGNEEGAGVTRGKSRAGSGVFTLSDLVSARKDGAIRTLGFQITFEGDTSVLRNFTNRVMDLPFPMRVASVRVSRVVETTKAPTSTGAGDGLAGLFGIPTGDDAEDSEEPSFDDTPIIEDNLSRFSVILEYIEIDLNAVGGDEPEETEGAA